MARYHVWNLPLFSLFLFLGAMISVRGFSHGSRIHIKSAHCCSTTRVYHGSWLSLITRDLSVQDAMIEPDYLITDSLELKERPALLDFLLRPRSVLRMLLLIVGTGISLSNILGNYNEEYLTLEAAGIALGVLNAFADFQVSTPPYGYPTQSVSPNMRCGVIDDAVVHLYASVYTASACWLALRAGPFCPPLLQSFDGVLGWIAASIFVFSLAAPTITLLHDKYQNLDGPVRFMVTAARYESPPSESLPPLTETEMLRAKSLLGVGVLGCVYAPMAIKLALGSQDWWSHVSELHTAQPMMESSTALFGVFATQASMIAHGAAKAGLAPFRIVAPLFAVVCLILTIFPCICALHWLGQDISFFSIYTE